MPIKIRDFKPGDNICLNDVGEKYLLPQWKKKTRTAIVTAVVTTSGDIIRVKRDGAESKEYTSHADYWQRANQ